MYYTSPGLPHTQLVVRLFKMQICNRAIGNVVVLDG